MIRMTRLFALLAFGLLVGGVSLLPAQENNATVRVFIFAGQSNMVGSDSKATDVHRFPPFTGLDAPQTGVRFSYCLGRENKTTSEGWVDLQPVNNIVGPELSFAREVERNTDAPIAIIKVAAGGTHLGGDWNPDQPIGFKMYPLALDWIRHALADLDKQGVAYRLEGFMWHQGENDMFDEDYMNHYGANLKNFLASWRRDLKAPELRFYIGELCTKTIWGMDLRPRMYAISLGQKEVTQDRSAGRLHPHVARGRRDRRRRGTALPLRNPWPARARSELRRRLPAKYRPGQKRQIRPLKPWPYAKGSKVKLFVLAGHRNMEGERAFVQNLAQLEGKAGLLRG